MFVGRCCKCNQEPPIDSYDCNRCTTGPAPINFQCTLTLPENAIGPTNPIKPCCSEYTSPIVITSSGLNCDYASTESSLCLGKNSSAANDISCFTISGARVTGSISGTLGTNIVTITVNYIWYRVNVRTPFLVDRQKFTWSFGVTIPLIGTDPISGLPVPIDYCMASRRLPFISQGVNNNPGNLTCGTGDALTGVNVGITPCGKLNTINSSTAYVDIVPV